MRVVLLGAPGAGKGTQAARLAASASIPHIATGDIFRSHVRDGTDLGRAARAYMDRGELVPDEVVVAMVEQFLAGEEAADGFVLDGFPRTVPQAVALDRCLLDQGWGLDAVLRLAVPEELIVARIVGRRTCAEDDTVYHVTAAPPRVGDRCDACGGPLLQRPDDTEAVVWTRLAEYHTKTAPLEQYYAERDLLVDVDGVGPVNAVTARAVAALDAVVPAHVNRVVLDITTPHDTAAAP